MKKHLFLLFLLSLTNFFWSQNVKILEHSSKIEFIELSKLNSQERECNLSVSPDGKTLYFMSTREYRKINKTYKDYNTEIFFTTQKDNGSWTKPKKAGDEINSLRNEDEPSLSSDGMTMYFQSWSFSWMRDGGPYYQVEFENGEWKNRKGLGGGINQFFKGESEGNYGYATDGMAISPDGNLFIVACGSVYNGDMDLYYSINANGIWSYPKIFPASTSGNERSVFIAADNKTIYFSSNGYDGIGGMDLYKTTFENGKIGEIINIGKPFNSSKDDMGFAITKNGNAAFLIRDLDIYYADLSLLEEDIKPIQQDKEISIKETKIDAKAENNAIEFIDSDIDEIPYFMKNKTKSFTVTFNFDKSTLTDDAKEVLKLIKQEVNENNYRLNLIGHTDNIGNEAYNSQLSANRVNEVEKWFKEQGIDVIKTDWKGENAPKVPNSDSKNRGENRRVEIILEPIK
jgi:outer membrane protein OmpA-like peptidoglycan-associated protein